MESDIEHLKRMIVNLESTMMNLSEDYRLLAVKVHKLQCINENLKTINEELIDLLEEW